MEEHKQSVKSNSRMVNLLIQNLGKIGKSFVLQMSLTWEINFASNSLIGALVNTFAVTLHYAFFKTREIMYSIT
jgi:hypothetical protein